MRLQLIIVLALLVGASAARADGELDARAVYYKERATRVEQPMLDGIFDVGTRGLLTAHFLVDAITSASAGSGAANGVAFVEHRYEGAAGYTHQVGRANHVGGDLKYSSYVASLSNDGTATSDKRAFVSLWNPLAQKDGLPTYQAAQL